MQIVIISSLWHDSSQRTKACQTAYLRTWGRLIDNPQLLNWHTLTVYSLPYTAPQCYLKMLVSEEG